ncbi:MAG: restriction endonuclease subunit S [Gammaproteobacteria bacterium]|nr:restriction endonuclease subunit S [Gammaproteobacteria bacterium]
MNRYTYATLGDLCDVSIGRTPRRNEPLYWGGPHPWATIRDLDGGILTATGQGITDIAISEVMPKPAEPNTLLFSFKLSIGKMAFAGRRMHHNEAIAALPIRDPDALDPEFLFYALRAKTHDDNSNHAVLGKVLNKRKVEEIEIPLPSLDEQRRIVGILNRATNIERLQAQAQKRLREFIPALFVRMFGDPAENPMKWPLCTLGELSILGPQYGANARSAPLVSGEPRYIRITDIQEGGNLSDESVGVALPDWEAYRLRDGDLLFARSGATVGKPYIHRPQDGLCVFAGYLIRFRLEDSKLHPEVAFGLTQTPAYNAWIKSKRRTAAQPNINGQEYATLRIPVPPLGLQRQYAQIVETARSTVALAESGVAVGSVLSASLMSRLLGTSD